MRFSKSLCLAAAVSCAALVGVLVAPSEPARAQYLVQTCIQLNQTIQQMQNHYNTASTVGHDSSGHVITANAAYVSDLLTDLNEKKAEYQTNCAAYKSGAVYPNFQILSLFYAPPGCSGSVCLDSGDVDYHQGSSAGTRVSADRTFKNANQSSVDITLGDSSVASLAAGGSTGYSISTTDSGSETITKEHTTDKKLTATGDGVDHNHDVFVLLMNPALIVRTNGTHTTWSIGYKGHAARYGQVTVADLKACSFGANSPFVTLKPADCITILHQDPFAFGSHAIDPHRFVQTTSTYSYAPSASCIVVNDTYEHSADTDTTHSVETEYTTGYSVEANASYGIVSADLKHSQDFTWTNSSSVSATTGSSQSASFSLPCPSGAYAGAEWIDIYWDTLYATFMFMPTGGSDQGHVVFHGQLTSEGARSSAFQPVTLTVGGRTYRTATNQNGEYQFFAPRNAAAVRATSGVLSVRGVRSSVDLRAAVLEQKPAKSEAPLAPEAPTPDKPGQDAPVKPEKLLTPEKPLPEKAGQDQPASDEKPVH